MRLDLLTAAIAGAMVSHGISVMANGLVFTGLFLCIIGALCFNAARNL